MTLNNEASGEEPHTSPVSGRDELNAAIETLNESELQSNDSTSTASPHRRRLKNTIQVLLVLLALGFATIGYVYRTLDREPEFYSRALEISSEANATAGDQFESQALNLQNSIRTTDKRWQARFSEAQINGWLATDLIEKFPETLPPNISDPRVRLVDEEITVVFRYRSPKISATVVAAVDIFCTDKPDQIALKFKSLKAGVLPIPLSRVSHRLDDAMQRIGVAVEWTEEAGAKIALLNFPPDLISIEGRQVRLDGLQVSQGLLILQGFVEPDAAKDE